MRSVSGFSYPYLKFIMEKYVTDIDVRTRDTRHRIITNDSVFHDAVQKYRHVLKN